jgi:ATP-dependent helicase/DNAse subunit B
MRHEHEIAFTLRADSAEVGEIMLEGRIDRLEIHRDGDRIKRIKVVDYKSSRNLDRYRELLRLDTFASHDFQMPVYALGVAEMFRDDLAPDVAIEASYIALKNRIKEVEPREIPLAMLETDPAKRVAIEAAGGATIAGRIAKLVAAALEGRFDIDPLSCSQYCPHRRVCRYNKSFSQL